MQEQAPVHGRGMQQALSVVAYKIMIAGLVVATTRLHFGTNVPVELFPLP